METGEKQVGGAGYRFLLLLLFFAAMNFQAKYFYFIFASVVVSIIVYRNSKLNMSFVCYIFLGILMAIYNLDNGVKSIFRCMAFPAAYYIGFSLSVNMRDCFKKGDILQRRLHHVLVALCAGTFVHYILNFILNVGNDIGRNTNDVWTGTIMSATGQTALACLMVGLSSAMIISSHSKLSFYLGLACTIGVLAYNMVLAGRTLIVLYLIVLTFGSIFYTHRTKQYTRFVKAIIGLLLVILVVLLVWNLNGLGIKDAFKQTNWYIRFFEDESESIASSGRTLAKMMFLKNMLNHPFGGLHMKAEFGYAHDLLLDGYDQYGLICLILLIAIVISGIRQMLIFCKNNSTDISLRTRFFCVYFCILLEFCNEPILAGMPWLFSIFCLINGATTRYNLVSNRQLCEGKMDEDCSY